MSEKLWVGWSKRHLWPEHDPEGYVFLAAAFDAVGSLMFPDWTGYEVEDAERPIPARIPDVADAYIAGKPHFGFHQHYGPIVRSQTAGLPSDAPIPADLWNAVSQHAKQELDRVRGAIFRRDMVVREMSDLALQGRLSFAARRKGGGAPMQVIEPAMWGLDYSWIPFATLSFHQDQGLASVAGTHWLFVTCNSLGEVLGLPLEGPPVADEQIGCSQGEDAIVPTRKPVPEAGTAWVRRVPTLQQSLLFKFFAVATVFMPGGERSKSGVQLHKTYTEWVGKNHSASKAVNRTTFLKWLSRFEAGYRIERKAWVLTH